MAYKQLWIWTGPVSAAKTEGALRIIRRLMRQRNRTGAPNSGVLIRPLMSKRSEEKTNFIKTKAGRVFPCVEVNNCDDIEEIVNNQDVDILWFDEIHFLRDEGRLFSVLQKLRKDHMILISGISATNELKPLGESMGKLLQVADRIFSELADCDFCGELYAASRTVHIGVKEKTTDVLLGGEESFRPACPNCWNEIESLPNQEVRKQLLNSADQ